MRPRADYIRARLAASRQPPLPPPGVFMRDWRAVTPVDIKLVLIALAAIAALVLLVTRLKVNAFIALLLASLIVGLSAVAMGSKSLTVVGVVKSFSTGLGNVMAG